jgi:hypothetical protein
MPSPSTVQFKRPIGFITPDDKAKKLQGAKDHR